MCYLGDLVDDMTNGLQSWIDKHDYPLFAQLNEDAVIENHYFEWQDENCHCSVIDCDCVVPELSDNDIAKRINELYEGFCADFAIDDIMEEMLHSLQQIKAAKSAHAQLTAFLFALHLNHVHGSIVDYCFLISYDMLNSLCNHGLEETVGNDAIESFIASW